ncbi:MAG: ribosome small subunit-dependent GTPase A [Lachnospiraceae bacterium]|nr:ribosome small subunit-dependent GTPase A [Lachnospiraceae bacterium]
MNDLKLEQIPERYEAFCKEYPNLSICLVILQEKGLYQISSTEGTHRARVSGKFQHDINSISDYPAVGDYVMADLNGASTAVIHTVLPRKSVFLRKAAGSGNTEQVVAANVDTVFLCMALNNDFNLRRLERYLSVAWDSGAMPVVLLTKADLCYNLPEKLAQVENVAVGVDIITVSAMESDGCQSIAPYLIRGNTLAFVGSSGVGKSTLINALLGEDRQKTNGLRNDDKGRHTTTHREIIALPGGAMVIDTPGMRELGMWDAGEGLSAAFADIEALAEGCRFRDCTHQTEPGCAVRAAVERGELSEARLLSYRKLRAENSYFEDGESYLAAKEKKFKKIARINKANQRK